MPSVRSATSAVRRVPSHAVLSPEELRTLPGNHEAERTSNNEVNITKKVRHRRDPAGELCPAASAMRTKQREDT